MLGFTTKTAKVNFFISEKSQFFNKLFLIIPRRTQKIFIDLILFSKYYSIISHSISESANIYEFNDVFNFRM